MGKLVDKYGRVHDYLRLSITDKCNFNCFYCNPHNSEKCNSNRNEILSYEELLRIIKLFASELGFKKIRFTGGEPLVRNGFLDFLHDVKKIKIKYGLEVNLTTNGSLLSDNLEKLKSTGVDRLNLSLDSLNKEKFLQITSKDEFVNLIQTIDQVLEIGYEPLKINTVIIKGINDDEILDFVKFTKNKNIIIRFIEFMPFNNNKWNNKGFINYYKMKEIVSRHYELIPQTDLSNTVTKIYSIAGHKGTVGFISPISEHFCNKCNRVRITSNGEFRLCLFTNGNKSLNFKELFLSGMTDREIVELLQYTIKGKWAKHPSVDELSQMKTNNMLKIGG